MRLHAILSTLLLPKRLNKVSVWLRKKDGVVNETYTFTSQYDYPTYKYTLHVTMILFNSYNLSMMYGTVLNLSH